MNPFELRGPDFLVFYIVFTIVALYITRALRRSLDGDDVSLEGARGVVSDPYALAFLRGGAIETLRVALMSLMDRGVIVVEGGGLKTAEGVEPAHLRKNVERTLVTHFVKAQNASTLTSLKSACDEYEEQLRQLRLIPDANLHVRRFGVLAVMVLIVGGVGAAKIFIGINRGRPVLFLIILTMLAVACVMLTCASPRTKHGDAFLDSMRTLFNRLKKRAATIEKGGANADLALLAAVYGVTEVPMAAFPLRDFLFPPKVQSSGVGTSSTCGSGSSCSSGCGGGCGGGGCGGCGG
jgi:uncharacterized protein (TIGR04222 family)